MGTPRDLRLWGSSACSGYFAEFSVKFAAMNPQRPYGPPPAQSRSTPLLLLFGFGGAAALSVVVILAIALTMGTGQAHPARTVASPAIQVGSADAYELGHGWGKNWWDAQGNPTPDRNIAAGVCVQAADGTLGAPNSSGGAPAANVPAGGRDRWVSGCTDGLAGQ